MVDPSVWTSCGAAETPSPGTALEECLEECLDPPTIFMFIDSMPRGYCNKCWTDWQIRVDLAARENRHGSHSNRQHTVIMVTEDEYVVARIMER